MLKKKSQIIAYHLVSEGASRNEWRTAYMNKHDNPADILTNMIPMSDKLQVFFGILHHHIFGSSPEAIALA